MRKVFEEYTEEILEETERQLTPFMKSNREKEETAAEHTIVDPNWFILERHCVNTRCTEARVCSFVELTGFTSDTKLLDAARKFELEQCKEFRLKIHAENDSKIPKDAASSLNWSKYSDWIHLAVIKQ